MYCDRSNAPPKVLRRSRSPVQLVIADQHAAVNMYPGPVHTARHTLGVSFAFSIRPMITLSIAVKRVESESRQSTGGVLS